MSSESSFVIRSYGILSPLGSSPDECWSAMRERKSCIRTRRVGGEDLPVAPLASSCEDRLALLRSKKKNYSRVDRTVLMAILTARDAVQLAGWEGELDNTAINIGSSRGATGLFERYHAEFLEEEHERGRDRSHVLTSPTTTLGNISSWVGQDLGADGAVISHSVTCSTAVQAIGNALAWLGSGMADRFIAGGAEAPLSPFTLAQMKALRIYSDDIDHPFPCRPLSSDSPGKNSMVLGEGGAVFTIERALRADIHSSNALAVIESFGSGMEQIESPTSSSENGLALQRSMKRALAGMKTPGSIDAVILHAPGTVHGDQAEVNAIREVFGEEPPILLSPKWYFGHLLGASGALSLAYAIEILRRGEYFEFPYPVVIENRPRPIRRILVNATGFGGNASSVVLSAGSVTG